MVVFWKHHVGGSELVFIEIFFRDIILRDLLRANFRDVRIRGILNARNGLCLEGLPLFQQFFHAFRVRPRHVGQPLCVPGLAC